MHFANYLRFMEDTEHAFCRALGFSVYPENPDEDGERIGWPRVHVECHYKMPLRFEEEVEVELLVEEIRPKTIHYLFRFWKVTEGEGGGEGDRALAAEGKLGVICVRFDAGAGKMKATDIPVSILEMIEEAPAELLAGEGSAEQGG